MEGTESTRSPRPESPAPRRTALETSIAFALAAAGDKPATRKRKTFSKKRKRTPDSISEPPQPEPTSESATVPDPNESSAWDRSFYTSETLPKDLNARPTALAMSVVDEEEDKDHDPSHTVSAPAMSLGATVNAVDGPGDGFSENDLNAAIAASLAQAPPANDASAGPSTASGATASASTAAGNDEETEEPLSGAALAAKTRRVNQLATSAQSPLTQTNFTVRPPTTYRCPSLAAARLC